MGLIRHLLKLLSDEASATTYENTMIILSALEGRDPGIQARRGGTVGGSRMAGMGEKPSQERSWSNDLSQRPDFGDGVTITEKV